MLRKKAICLLSALVFGVTPLAAVNIKNNDTKIVKKNKYFFEVGRATLEDIVKKEPKIRPYKDYIKESIEKYKTIYDVAPSIIVAILKFETSNFNRYAISPAGAAGIAQFIPETAIEKFKLKAYYPSYLKDARNYKRLAIREEAKAIYYLKKLNTKEALKHMKLSILYNKKSKSLFSKYKKDLISLIKNKDGSYKSDEELSKIDERFLPKKAIDAMVHYVAELLKARNGDIREAVSAYNAGLHAVEIYGGIPPYDQTVKYQNKIMNKIKEYEGFK